MNRCITCYRCTRYYRDYAGGTDLAAMAAHDHVYFGRHEEGVLQSEFAGNLVEVCPTGVFTDKTLIKEYTRKWDLQSAPSVCAGCAVGCNTIPGERYGKLKRVHNRFNAEVNGYFLCDRGRFGASFVNSEKKLEFPGLRLADGRFDATDHHSALMKMLEACKTDKIAGIGSPRASVESNYLLSMLVGPDNFAPGFSDAEQPLVELALQLQQNSPALTPDIPTIESADAVLILGEDLTNTAPRIALALRQSVRNKAYEMAAELRLESWQDAAIRNLAQNERSPLFIATTGDTRLDDIAEERASLSPNDIAELGFTVANLIAGESPGTANQALVQYAQTIANALKGAQRPLIVSGTGCGSEPVMQAAAQIAQALSKGDKRAMLSLAVAEVNSLGQAMLTGPGANTLADLGKRAAAGKIETLIVVENDLYRRGPKEAIDAFLANIKNIIVMDSLDNPTLSASSLALPAASFAESEGTTVSMEGRAQRYFPVFLPQQERRSSWVWLLACMKEGEHEDVRDIHHFDDITRACASAVTALGGITGAAPDHHFRNVGMKIPRQTHRYSGRTAMRANVSVHEPKQPVDEESPLAFSMEGLNRAQPGSLLPYVWAPGWNSNQALHKFQSEVGGHLKGGTAGTRLLLPTSGSTRSTGQAPGFEPAKEVPAGQWLMVARYRIFGSDELSAQSPAIAELVEPGFIEINSTDAAALALIDGDGITLAAPQTQSQGELLKVPVATLEVRVNDNIAQACAGYSVGLAGTENIICGSVLVLGKAENWRRHKPQIIGSDGGGHV